MERFSMAQAVAPFLRRICGGLLLLGGFVACGPGLPPAPLLPRLDPAFKPVQLPPPKGLAEEVPEPFRILPGDVLNLKTISRTPLGATNLVVDATGGLHVPLVGSIFVRGLTLREAELKVEKELRQFDRFARVGLNIATAMGHQAIAMGALKKTGRFPIRPGLRVADLLALSGGPLTSRDKVDTVDLADLAAARLIRARKTLPISIDLAMEGDPRHNVLVRPGDMLFVPPIGGKRVIVLGEVKSPTTLPFRKGMRLTEALARTGGFSKDADYADVRLIRGPLSKPRVYHASIKNLVYGRGADVVLQQGDIVFVTSSGLADFANVMSRLTPLLAILTAGFTAGALLR